MTPIVIIFAMQKGHTAMLQSLFGYRPRPAFADLSGFDIRYLFLGFVNGSARDVFAFSHTEDFICHSLFAVIKNIPNQFFSHRRFGFGRITTEQFFCADAHIRFFAKATDEQHTTSGGTEVNRAESSVL